MVRDGLIQRLRAREHPVTRRARFVKRVHKVSIAARSGPRNTPSRWLAGCGGSHPGRVPDAKTIGEAAAPPVARVPRSQRPEAESMPSAPLAHRGQAFHPDEVARGHDVGAHRGVDREAQDIRGATWRTCR
jgi:hypothetical protein